jgi:CoA-dependent NAD(P)H sulfur oxidoreductase
LIAINKYIAEKKVKNVLIIGSGYIGIEAADALSELGMTIDIIERSNMPLPYDEIEIQKKINQLLEEKNIRFFGGAPKLDVKYEGGKIKSVNIEGRIVNVDLVLIAIGFKPNNFLAETIKLEIGESGGLKVNSKQQTSDMNIFAAGDNCEIINAVTNRQDYIPLSAIAHACGHVAGENAAGGNKRIEPFVKNIAIKIFNKFNVSVGLSSQQAENHNYYFDTAAAEAPNIIEVMPNSQNVFGKIIYEKSTKKILGASFLGGRETSGYGDIISALIRTNQSADVLARINYNYTPPLSPFINLLSILGRKIK